MKRTSDARRAALLDLAALLAPDAAAVATDVALAYDEPTAYLRLRKTWLAERGITKPTNDLPWLALVVALEHVQRLASIDWKTSMQDLVGSLDRLASLPNRSARWAWSKNREDLEDDRSLLEVLEIVGERLVKDDRLQLAQLDIGADEYELILVATKDVKRLIALGKQARYGDIDLFTGSDLAAFERERTDKEKAAERKSNADPNRQRNFIHPDGRVWITFGSSWSPTDRPEQHFAFFTTKGKLGYSTHSNGADEKRVTRTASELARWRADAIAAHLAEGFAELSTPDYAAKENAAQRARKRKPKRKKR